MRIYAEVDASGATWFRHASVMDPHISFMETVTYLLACFSRESARVVSR
jgi:hypothetical protein